MEKERIQETEQEAPNKKSIDDLLKEQPNITIQEAMKMGYSYNEIIFGE